MITEELQQLILSSWESFPKNVEKSTTFDTRLIFEFCEVSFRIEGYLDQDTFIYFVSLVLKKDETEIYQKISSGDDTEISTQLADHKLQPLLQTRLETLSEKIQE